MPDDTLIPIGTFARATGLTTKALRLYADARVVTPARVDEGSGYRYYRAEQVATGQLVRMLRQLGLSVAEVRDTLAQLDRGLTVTGRLEAHLAAQRADLAARRRLLDRIVDRLGGSSVSTPVLLTTLRHHPALYTSATISASELPEFARDALARLHAEVARHMLVLPRPLYIRYHGHLSDPTVRADVDICLPYDDEQTRPGALSDGIGVLPAEVRQYATTRVRGRLTAYPDVLEGYDTVARWMTEHAFAIDGPAVEIYWRWTATPGDERNELEVGFPVGD